MYFCIPLAWTPCIIYKLLIETFDKPQKNSTTRNEMQIFTELRLSSTIAQQRGNYLLRPRDLISVHRKQSLNRKLLYNQLSRKFEIPNTDIHEHRVSAGSFEQAVWNLGTKGLFIKGLGASGLERPRAHLPINQSINQSISLEFIYLPTASLLQVLRIPGVLLAASSIIVTSVSIGFLQATLEPHLRQFNLSPVILGLMFVINGGTYALTAPCWGWLCDRKLMPKIVTATGCLLIIVGFLLVGPAPFVPGNT
jgi:hypothetical protein